MADNKYTCKNCAKYKGNCGHHLRDINGHINYDCPSESMWDGCLPDFGPNCWEPNAHIINTDRELRIVTIMSYSIEEIKEALNRLKNNK